jgi:amino acid transporter
MKMSVPKAYVREATGFIRELGPIDSTIYAIAAMVGPTWIPVFATLWFILPGVSIPLAFVIMGILAVIHGFYYVLITTAMPRSGGGGYVALSRIVHPGLGIAASMIFTIANLIDLAFIANISITIGVGSPLATYGVLTGNAGLQAIGDALAAEGGKNMYGFIASLIFTIVTWAIVSLGMARVIKANRVAMVFATLGMILIAGVLLSISQEDFVRLFNNFAGAGMYSQVIAAANTAGWAIPADFVGPTMISLPVVYFAFIGYHYPTYLGGELKRATRTMMVTVTASILYTGFWFVFLAVLFERAIGIDFLTAMGYLYFTGNAAYPLTVPPWVNTFLIIMNSNLVLNILIILSFLAFGYFLNMHFFMTSTRIMFAWSFDRAAPEKFAEINDRLHSPVFLVTVILVIGIFLSILYHFTPAFTLVNLAFFFVVAFLPEGLAGMLLPWRKKELFEASAPIVKKKIAGIPIISILGAYGVVLNVALLILCLMNPFVIGDINPFSGGGLFNWGAVIAMGLAGVALLYITRAYYKSKGIPVELIFKEIPPE